jgi:hypothetical protein
MSAKQPEHVKVYHDGILKETDAAVLIEIDGEEYWIPLSQVHSMHHGDTPYIMMTPWIAKQKGLM